MGREFVGLPVISFKSKIPQNINVSYGELLEDGHVKRLIGDRDFSFDYYAKAGENKYTNYMLRCVCRYFEIEYSSPIEIDYIGIIPQSYPIEVTDFEPKEDLDRKIYEICINTLKLCMMEHYVDCPWREQCMYAFDSRNQMLLGYYAFCGVNLDYARANLLLMGKDSREDNILSICFPSASDLTIPSFSLYYILAVKEYLDHSGDLSLAEEVFDKLTSILKVFLDNMENGLVCKFEGENRWNFYDWSTYAWYRRGQAKKVPDFLINAIVIIGLNSYNAICEKLSANSLVPCSLSMKTFKYDAMLKVDKDKYKVAILNEIRATYKVMLDQGSTTVWETIEGATAFENAGSLCHGWSAIPVYYYNLFENHENL